MDIEYYEIAVLGICGTAFVLCYNAYYKYKYLEQKSSDDTYKERVDADIRMIDKTKELLNDQGYIEYLDKRVDVCKKLDLPKDTFPIRIKELIDAVVGPYSLEEKKE